MSNYTPQQGSVAWKVIEFLTTNPEEALTKNDVAAKFDKPVNNIHSLLGPAVEAGVLKRGTDDDGEVTYALGKGTPAIKPNKAANPTLRPDALMAGGEAGKRRSPPPEIDLAAVSLRDGVPLPVAKTGGAKWPALLDRMQVGQSCVMPLAHKGAAGAAISKENTAPGGRKFAVRKISATEFGLWRLK